jgi:hypothetical protein
MKENRANRLTHWAARLGRPVKMPEPFAMISPAPTVRPGNKSCRVASDKCADSGNKNALGKKAIAKQWKTGREKLG